jgi:protocatechuate 3,4-dioxygenase alpha subunit
VYDRFGMSHTPTRLVATPSQTVGPFFHFGLADQPGLGCLVRDDTPGERIRLRVTVLDGAAEPVPDALIELWQANADGVYVRPDNPLDVLQPTGFCGFGRLPTGADGTCEFETIRPGSVRDAQGRPQASHINICLLARGLLRQIYTRIYFEGDALLASDAVLNAVPEARRHTLIATKLVSLRPDATTVSPKPDTTAARAKADTTTATTSGTQDWAFVIRLQGEDETVFLDL